MEVIIDGIVYVPKETKTKLEMLEEKYKSGNYICIGSRVGSKFTRVEIISSLGRVFCDRCDDNSHYVLSIQDDGKTLKLFEVKDK